MRINQRGFVSNANANFYSSLGQNLQLYPKTGWYSWYTQCISLGDITWTGWYQFCTGWYHFYLVVKSPSHETWFFLSIGCCCFFWVLNRNNIQDLFVGTDFDKRILHSRFSGNFSGCSVPSRPPKLPSNLECRILSMKSTVNGLRPFVVDFTVNHRLRRYPACYF